MILVSSWLMMTFMAACLVALCMAAFQLAPVIRLRPWNILIAFVFAVFLSIYQADMSDGVYSVNQYYQNLIGFLRERGFGWIAGPVHRYFHNDFPFGLGSDAALSVLVNLLIVVAYALTRTAMMYLIFGVQTLVLMLGFGPWGVMSRIRKIFERGADNATIKIIARTAYLLQIIAIIALPTLFLAADGLDTKWAYGAGIFITSGFSGLLWAFSFIICAELYVAIFQPQTLIGGFRALAADEAPSARRLLPLFETYRALPVAPFLAKIDEPAPAAETSPDPSSPDSLSPDPSGPRDPATPAPDITSTEALVARLGPLIGASEREALKRTLDTARSSEEPRFLWLAGTLSEPYYHIVVEMMLSVHDKGGVALVICPADIREKVADNIKHTIGAELFDMMIRWRFTGRSRAAQGGAETAGPGGRDYHNLLIGAETDLYDDFMSGRHDSIRYEASRLKLIVVVDFHRLDLALLRLEMRRLEVSAGSGSPFRVSVVAQGERRRGMDTQLSQIFPVGTSAFETVTFRPSRARARFWLGWRDDGDFADALHERFIGAQGHGEGPQTLYPALMIPAMTFGSEDANAPVRLAYYDPDKGFDRYAWSDSGTWYSALQSSEDDAVRAAAPLFQTLQPLSHIGRRDGGDVVFMEDRANLPDVIDRQVDVLMDRDDAMLVTVSAGYPLRDYFIARSEEWVKAKTLAMAEADLPLSPDPGTDLGQLANAVLAMIRQQDGVRQEDIAAFMTRIAPGPLLETLGINATKIGLERLFELALGIRETVRRIEDVASHLVRLKASTTGADDIVSTLFMRVDADGKELCKLQQGDEGLLFTRSSLMQVEGRMYRVIDVKRSVDRAQVNAVIVRKADADWRNAQLRAAPLTLFSRRYAIDSTRFVQERALDRDRHRSALLHLSYDRVTDRLCTVERDRPPFLCATDERPARAPSWMGVEDGDGTGSHTERRRYQSAWSLVLPHGGGEEAQTARIAMTLCVTLQDTIRSLFPRNWQRLAVISPQGAILAAEKRLSGAPHEQFLARAYPMLDPDTLAHTEALLGGAECAAGGVHLLVIEDAAYGLGCVRALFGLDAIPGLWIDSLRWRASSEGGPEGYHAFGSGQAQTDLLDYAGALQVLERAV